MGSLIKFKTLAQWHAYRNFPPPEHPLISIIDISIAKVVEEDESSSLLFDFYAIGLKRGFKGKLKYGQQLFDFDSGVLTFSAPGQVLKLELEKGQLVQQTGWVLLIHPDYLWNTSLAKKIKHYEFFDYAVNESLFLSEKEEAILTGIVRNIEREYHTSIDKFSQEIVIPQIETLLAYSERFYNRQFITRKKANHQILDKLDDLLNAWFEGEEIVKSGPPTVVYLARQLNISPRYLSGLLHALTGLNTQQHIQLKLIDKAKELLSTTQLSVSEIAYALGFGHLQSFSKLFKTKTNQSPLEFRQSFN
jgi:AraC family transcriptional regulator, transcriptional activator of pobA